MNLISRDRKFFAFAVLLVSFVLCASSVHGAELSTSANRTVLSENETLELTVRLNEQIGYSSPDFQALERDFEILSQQRSSQFRNINGRTEAWTDWTLILAPKATGTLSIPSFSFEGATSSALQVTVTESNAVSAGEQRDIFVEVETDKPEVSVQEQLLVTVKIHTGIMLRDASMTEDLSVEDAVVESISETAYNKQLDGRMYRVMELVYAVYPQKSSPITIPSMSWNLVMATDRGSGLRYRFQAPGQMRRLRSEPMVIPVNPRPSQYTGQQWLPARDVKLEQHWSSDPSRFVVGEPLTRTITLQADGLTSAQLPPLPDQSVDGVKIYSDQPQLDDIKDREGVVGSRIESVAIVPTQEGELILPEVAVSWWDTEAQQQRTATLPEQVLAVAPAATNHSTLPLAPPSSEASADAPANGETTAGPSPYRWPWLVSNAVFAGLALLFMLAWLQARKRQQEPVSSTRNESSETLNEAFHAVRRACSENNVRAARNSLSEWGKLYWQLPRAASLQEIIDRSDSDALTKEVAELDKILYGCYESSHNQAADWQGDRLWRALVKFKRKDQKARQEQEQTDKDQLPPLYPTTH